MKNRSRDSSQHQIFVPSFERLVLWIDGVGGFLVLLGSRMTIGGPSDSATDGADLSLLAPLSRHHATIRIAGDGHVLEPLRDCRVDGVPAEGATPITGESELHLGDSVRLGFRRPSSLSSTCRIDFVGGHRPDWSCDAALLVQDTLLLGPGSGNHVVCPDWSDTVILFRRESVLHCQSRVDLRTGDDLLPSDVPVPIGRVVHGGEIAFRLELAEPLTVEPG